MVPGAPVADAPVTGPHGDWLLQYLGGGFDLVVFGGGVSDDAARDLAGDPVPCRVVQVGGKAGGARVVIQDKEGLIAARYDARPGTCYLVRPDQHVCARWRAFDPVVVRGAIARATGNSERDPRWAH
jgi:3-(3-hydroxy-phenyl)propionate hydroxylase